MKHFLIFLITIFSISSNSQNLIDKTYYKKPINIVQWEVVDIAFYLSKTPKNPFNIEFGAVFTNDNNETIKVPGFYNGDKEWIIRFSNKTIGKWHYTTYSTIKNLNGRKGLVSVKQNIDKTKHGGIAVNPKKPQYFSYEDGTPYMTMAFECDWLFALDYENKTDAPKSEHLLDLLQENNFNQIVTTVYSYDVGWDKYEKLKDHSEQEYGGNLNIYPFLGTNKNPDYSALNIDFFKQFDRSVALMNNNDIVAHLMIYVWNKKVNWPDPESEADNMYFDYIIKRYQAFPNVIWDVSKEALNNARCTEAYGVERIQRIRKNDAYKRLVSVHDYGFCIRNSDQVDFISTQDWSSTLYHTMLTVRENYSKLPIFNIEHGGYEMSHYEVFPGDYANPEVCMRRNYLCAFAGTYSTYYWQGAAWNVIIHNPFEQPEEFPKPKFHYYKHFVDFFKKYPFSEFEPAPEYNLSSYCLKNDNNIYLMYIPKENEKLSFYGKRPLATKEGAYQWFNAYTGAYSEVFNYAGEAYFTSPWKGEADAILIRNTNK
jgi:hypothetical protein